MSDLCTNSAKYKLDRLVLYYLMHYYLL